jgi:WD40 repeat protein
MTASEKQASANILALLQGKPAASRVFAKPAAPRALSREDALSLRIHASSALVPNAAVISPVVRVHLVHPELGSPVRPSGEATTPMQTAPFDMTRRRAATFAAEWQETLEVEEALGDVLGARAVALFEVLQLPPSFTYYEERSASFPGGQPMRVAWGFLKLLRGSDGKPNMGRLKVQLYRWDDRVGVLGLGAAAAVDAAADAPEVFKEWKRALQVAPSLRRLYPAHLDVTVASSPRTDVVAALLSAPRPGADAPPLAIAAPPAAQKSLSGVGDDEDAPRPTRRERIDRERAMGGGWRNAETRLARAPVSDREEIAEKLGRLPHETLCYGVNPKAAAAAREAQVAAEAEAATPGLSGSTSWKAMSAKRAVVKLPHARAKQEECLIPNADARTQPHLPDTASEATLASFDPMGRRLAVVCREGAMYAVRVFDASTGALIAAFPGHASTVYDVQWAPERGEAGGAHAAADALGTVDFAAPATRVLTASADGAARAWRVPAMGEDPVSEAAANAFDIVAQHACGCYSAAWHPTAPGVLATGARDGGVRLWATDDAAGAGGVRNARVIAAVASAPGVAATAMAFDRTGLRLWVGFADGVVREHRVDVTPRDGSANEGPSVKSLRECKDLLGEPITCLRAGPTDRRLFARTVADRVAAVDVGFFAATHTFECDGGARGTMRAIRAAGAAGALRSAEGAFAGSAASGAASAGRPLARLALSPDGRWMVAGGPDGSARLFDVDVGGIGVMLPAASVPPGVRVNDVAWSPAAHCVAVCAAGGARPLRLAAHSETARAVGSAAAAEASAGAERLGGQPRRQAAPEDGGGDETAARGCRVRQRRERRAKEPIARETHARGCARDARQGAHRKRRATTRRAGGGQTREESGNGFCRGRGGCNGRGGSALRGCGAAVRGCRAVRRRSARGGLRAGGANGFAPRAELAEWSKENEPAAALVPAPAPAPAPAFPSFDPYGGSVGVGLGASTVGAGAQPRAPAGPY